MKHTFLYKEIVAHRETEDLSTELKKVYEYKLGLLIDYTDSTIREADTWTYDNFSECYPALALGRILDKEPEEIHYVYSDELTKQSCIEYFAFISKITPYPNLPFSYTPEDLLRYQDNILKKVQFLPFSNCPEDAYKERIEQIFSERATSKMPGKDIRQPFHGSREAFDQQIIKWTQG